MLARDMDGYTELRNDIISEQKEDWKEVVETLDTLDIDITDTTDEKKWTMHLPMDGKAFCVWRCDDNSFRLAGYVGARWYKHWTCFRFKQVI